MRGGIQNIREACYARRSALTRLSKDVGVRTELLDAFMRGNADLPPAVIDALVREIWNDRVILDHDADLLCPRESAPARSLGTPPPPRKIAIPKFTPGPPPRGPQPVEPAPKKQPRPGWRGVW